MNSVIKKPKADHTEVYPAARFKNMGMGEFVKYFDPDTVRRHYLSVATILGLLKALDPLAGYDGKAPREILTGLGKKLDEGFRSGSPVTLRAGESRPSFVASLQFYEDGRLRMLSLNSWGVRAGVYFQAHDRTRPEQLYLKYKRGR